MSQNTKDNLGCLLHFLIILLFTSVFMVCVVVIDNAERDSTKIADVISQEFVGNEDLTVINVDIVESKLWANLGNRGIFDSGYFKESDIKGEVVVEYTLSDYSKLTKEVDIKDIRTISDVDSVISYKDYYKGVYKTNTGETRTIKSKNKLQVGDSLTESMVEANYNWKTVELRKQPIKVIVKVSYTNSNGKVRSYHSTVENYVINP